MLPSVPVLPVLQLFVSVLVLTEHHHDDALAGGGKRILPGKSRVRLNKSFLGHKGLKIAGKLEVKAEDLKSCAQICVCQPWLMAPGLTGGDKGGHECTERRWRTNPDFADGLTETFVGAQLVEGHSVELAFVQVGHGPLALLLAQGARGIQRVLEAVAAEAKPSVSMETQQRLSYDGRAHQKGHTELTFPPEGIRSHRSPERTACGTSAETEAKTQKEEASSEQQPKPFS